MFGEVRAVSCRGTTHIPRRVDERGRTLIPWVRGREWTRQFEHKPASAVLRLHRLRENHRRNQRQAAAMLQLVFASEFLPDFNELGELLSHAG